VKLYPVNEDQLQEFFGREALNENQKERYDAVEKAFKAIGRDVQQVTRMSAEQTLALRHLQMAKFYTSKAIAMDKQGAP